VDRFDDMKSARFQLALSAATRWQQRAKTRIEQLTRLAKDGPAAADSPERVGRFRAMQEKRVVDGLSNITLERIIGPTLDFTSRPPNENARRAGNAVCRIVEMRGKGIEPVGFGTGFLVSPDLMLTNHHVLPGASDARGIGANFGYEQTLSGLAQGDIFELEPDRFFLSHEALDFALVAIKSRSQTGLPLDSLGFNPLIRATGKILIGHPINIIQHPEGGFKRYAVSENKLIDVLDTFLHYETDTLPGSSGSPSFNDFWEVVALHHSGVPEMRDGKIMARDGRIWDKSMPDEAINWIANEGVRISRIVAFLGDQKMPDEPRAELLTGVLRAAEARQRPTTETSASTDGVKIATRNAMSDAANAIIQISGNAVINIANGPPSFVSAGSRESIDPRNLEKVSAFDNDYGNRHGYDRTFLTGHDVPWPTIANKRMQQIFLDRHNNPLILDYHHYSIVQNKQRRLPMWAASNADYTPRMRNGFKGKDIGTPSWRSDPRIPESIQLSEAFYDVAGKFDKGHLVRRDDSEWGRTRQEIEFANSDTFHLTNCTPQHEAFNRSNKKGLWGRLENHLVTQATAVGGRLIIFSGPILAPDDPEHDFGEGFVVQYPNSFWKVIIVSESDGGATRLAAYGFILEQKSVIKKLGVERFDVGDFHPFHYSLQTISERSDVVFDDILTRADRMKDKPGERRLLRDEADLSVPPPKPSGRRIRNTQRKPE
jgi:endonuclease G, mitochondrial